MPPFVPEVPLKEYVERLITEQEKRFEQRATLVETALEKAERTLETRLHGMNEFRDALREQASKMATRVELENVVEDVQELRRNKANLDGRLAVTAGAVSLIVAALFHWFSK